MTFLRVLLLMVLTVLPCSAKLPPIVEEVYPGPDSVVATDTEFWLFGPTLSSFDRKSITLKSESDESMELDIERLPCDDYRGYQFEIDWRGRSGDAGNKELLVVRSKSELKPETGYTLSYEGGVASYKTGPGPDASGPPEVVLESAKEEYVQGFDFDGNRMKKTIAHYSVKGYTKPLRLELLAPGDSQPLAFVVVRSIDGSLQAPLKGLPEEVSMRAVTITGEEGEPTPAVAVKRNLNHPRTYVLALVVVIGLGGGFWFFRQLISGKS